MQLVEGSQQRNGTRTAHLPDGPKEFPTPLGTCRPQLLAWARKLRSHLGRHRFVRRVQQARSACSTTRNLRAGLPCALWGICCSYSRVAGRGPPITKGYHSTIFHCTMTSCGFHINLGHVLGHRQQLHRQGFQSNLVNHAKASTPTATARTSPPLTSKQTSTASFPATYNHLIDRYDHTNFTDHVNKASADPHEANAFANHAYAASANSSNSTLTSR